MKNLRSPIVNFGNEINICHFEDTIPQCYQSYTCGFVFGYSSANYKECSEYEIETIHDFDTKVFRHVDKKYNTIKIVVIIVGSIVVALLLLRIATILIKKCFSKKKNEKKSETNDDDGGILVSTDREIESESNTSDDNKPENNPASPSKFLNHYLKSLQVVHPKFLNHYLQSLQVVHPKFLNHYLQYLQ